MNSIWKEIKNFTQLQDCMIKYLQGEYKCNPWVCDKIDPETVPILQSLIDINRSGFITLVSQPGVNIIWPDGTVEYQRAFITGFIPKDKCDRFIDSLIRIGKIVISKQEIGSVKPPELYGDYQRLIMTRPLKRESNGEVIHGTGRFINLTKEVIPEGDPFLNSLDQYERDRIVTEKGKYVRYYTNHWLDYECDETDLLIDSNPDLADYLRKNACQLTIIRSEYGDADLHSIITL